jgi:ATP-dependent Clp protease ATP-binding subunit ClpC
VFERFTEQARQVVVMAQEEARALGHDYIGTEHILLGLLRDSDGTAARALASLGVTLVAARAQVVEAVGYRTGQGLTGGQIPFTPRGKKALELALRESLNLGQNYVGSEHLLLGLIRVEDGMAARVLLTLGADAEKIGREVISLLGDPSPRSAPERRAPRLARDLDAWIRVGVGVELRRLLMVAAARALDDRRTDIEPGDVLLALTRDEKTGALLAGLGVDEQALREAIERARASEEPPAAAES